AAVVAEVQLPGADGFAFCGRLRADRRTARMPFILLSESANTRQVELATGVGADDFVVKPTYLRDVAALVRLKAGATSSDASFRAFTDALPLPELLRALLSGVRSGKVEVEHEGGEITFQRGRLVDATLREQRGLNALLPILLLADGAYTVTFTGMVE